MNTILKTVEIDLYSPTSYEVIKAQQGDKDSRIIEFVLYDKGLPYKIPDNVAVFMEGHRGDNTFFEPKTCTVSDNIITTVLDGDILSEPGTAEAKIVMYDSEHDAILSSIPFIISIQKHPCDKNKIEAAKRSVIDWLTLNFEKLKKRVTSAESAIEEETRRASDSEETITENLNAEITRATGKENEIADNLAEETERASDAENELDAKKADLESPSLTGVPTAPTAPPGTNTGQLATTAFVHTAVSDGIAASDAMIFKGTIGTDGTVATLPSTYKTGWTYRVITEGTYAGEACEIGDLIIALTDRDGSGNQDSDWCVAQTNIDGAVTGIKGTDGYISCTRSGSSVTISHEDIEKTDTSSSQTISDKSMFSAVKSMTVDDKGHVTGVETEDLTLDFSASGVVTGVKGDSETKYRGGNVSLSAEDTGALPISGGTMTGQIQIPAIALNWPEGKDLSRAAIGMIRPNVPSAYFSFIAEKTLSNYVWSLGSIQDEFGFYVYQQNEDVPSKRFVMDAATGTVKAVRLQVYEGIDVSYPNPINVRHIEGADGKEIYLNYSHPDKNVMFGNAGHNINSNGSQYTGNAATATGDENGNNIANTYAKKSIYGDNFVSLGRKSGTTVGYRSAVLGGTSNEANGYYASILGGEYNTAIGDNSSVLAAYYSEASSEGSVVLGGSFNKASGENSVALGGFRNKPRNYGSVVCGKCNKLVNSGGNYNNQIGDVFVIGNGTSSSSTSSASVTTSNALRVTYLGDILGTKAFQSSGADYAEFIKPWADGNPDNEDRVGYFVTVKNELLHKANDGDYITGITSGNPSVVGNADEDYYWRYERDEFNRIVMEDVPETIQATDDDGNPLFDEETHEPIMVETGKIIKNARMKLAEDYDPSKQDSYIPRAERPEWDYVGMVGVLPVRDDGTCIPGQFCKCGQNGIAAFAAERGFDTYMVLERIAENVVSVIVK